jgi:hypothetical protein
MRQGVHLGQVGFELAEQGRRQAGQVNGARRDSGGVEDLADPLPGAAAVGPVLGSGVGPADLVQQAGVVHGCAVHRHAEEELLGAVDRGQVGLQLVEEDVVGGEGDGLGKRRFERGVLGEPGVQARDVRAGGQGVGEPGGHVVVRAAAAGEERVEVLQAAGVPADHLPDPGQVGFAEAVQAGQRPRQLHRLRRRQRPDGLERQAPVPAAR